MRVRDIGAGLVAATLAVTVATTAMAQERTPQPAAPTETVPVAAAQPAAAAAPGPSAATAVRSAVDQTAQVVGELVEGLTCLPLVAGAPPLCSHGPDPAPEVSETTSGSAHMPAGGTIGCYGTGKDGDRVLAYYAYVQGQPDRFRSYAPSIQKWAAAVDNTVSQSAAETGGVRHVRWVTDKGTAGCQVVVGKLAVSPDAAKSMTGLIKEMQAKGLDRPNIKYLVWMDADVVCGQATVYVDSKPGQDNLNNGAYASYARVDRPCWNYGEAHELMHMLGGVQPDAPHATKAAHCTDGADVMCYDDGTGATQHVVCGSDHTWRYDCRHDDYFSTKPAAGSWLAGHWNAASSAFLAGAPAPAPAPAPAKPAPQQEPQPAPQPSPSQSPAPSSSLTTTTGGVVGSVVGVVTGLLGSK